MWEILGIEPTTDIKAIKSAYAKLAKQFNPEEHPEEFQRVYAAYKSACVYAKAAGNSREVITQEKEPEETVSAAESINEKKADDNEQKFDFSCIDIFPDYDLPMEKRFEKMLDNMRNLLADTEKKDSIPAWHWILKKDDFELLADNEDFRAAVGTLLADELFSPETASAIARTFGRGTRAIPCKKDRSGQERWRVWISKSGRKAPPRGYKMPSYTDSPYSNSKALLKIMAVVMIIAFLANIFILINESSENNEYQKSAETTATTRSVDMGGVTIYLDENGHVVGMDK